MLDDNAAGRCCLLTAGRSRCAQTERLPSSTSSSLRLASNKSSGCQLASSSVPHACIACWRDCWNASFFLPISLPSPTIEIRSVPLPRLPADVCNSPCSMANNMQCNYLIRYILLVSCFLK